MIPVMMITSELFTYNSRTNNLTAEASDLQWQVIPDTFQVKSHKTGKIRTFKKTFTCRNRDNDVEYWRYTCREDTKLNAVIFND